MADGLRFAIIDDDLGSATIAKVLLEGAGQDTTIFTSPEEALHAIPTNHRTACFST